jgi:hypothetical protein
LMTIVAKCALTVSHAGVWSTVEPVKSDQLVLERPRFGQFA